MTKQEAIEVLKDFDKQVSVKADGAYQSTIGKIAYDIAVSALEKQIPKKPTPYGNYAGKCICGKVFICSGPYYCVDCGQRLDWS